MIGKKNSTLKKQSVKENKLLTTGVKALKFWHQASAGESSIAFGSLVMPNDVAVNGFSNPSSTEILASNLALFQNNVTVTSSLNGVLMHGLTCVVKNSQIRFVGGYVALAGEIFEVVYKNDVITGTNVVDARPLTATGVVAAGSVLFATGEAFKTNQYPETQLGEVLVYVDGMLQFRNVGNATAIGSADGNYQEIAAVGGYGSMIKFNETSIIDRNVQVISRNLIAERPDISMMQFIETTQGQLDALIPTVAALAGVPESTFQSAPNQVDLKVFGDVVTNLSDNLIPRVEILENRRPGDVVQIVNFQTSSVATGSTAIPRDDTIPQNTEGTEFMQTTITPTSASDRLIIEIILNGNNAGTFEMVMALFKDSNVNAIGAWSQYTTAASNCILVGRYEMIAGTTSPLTFKVRAGNHGGGAFTFNGEGGGRKFGGVCYSSIKITQVKA